MTRALPLLILLRLATGCPHDFSRPSADRGIDAPLPPDAGHDAPRPDHPWPDGPPDLALTPDFGCRGLTLCGDVCADLATDPAHCGSCGAACAPGLDCVGGSCACIAGGLCTGCCQGNVCLPPGPTQSLTQCGAAGQACKSCDDQAACSTDSCSAGACQNVPTAGYCLIDGVCHAEGAYKSALKCLQCQSAKDALGWTGLPNTGCVATLAGSGAIGSTNGPAHLASFNYPFGVAVDSAGAVYVGDSANHLIRLISGGTVSTFAGTGTFGFLPFDGALAVATFSHPDGLALDGATLYVAERGFSVIRKIAGGQVSVLAGVGIDGNQDGQLTAAYFSGPTGLAVAPGGTFFVADRGNHLIRRIAAGQVSRFAGVSASSGILNGPRLSAQFDHPIDVVVDAAGAVLVADQDNHCIRKIENDMVTTLAGQCKTSGIADGSLTVARFKSPSGLALDAAGAIYVADCDNHAIRKISGGQVETLAGTGQPGDADGPLSTATFLTPKTIAVSSSGAIYVADQSNNKIRVIVP